MSNNGKGPGIRAEIQGDDGNWYPVVVQSEIGVDDDGYDQQGWQSLGYGVEMGSAGQVPPHEDPSGANLVGRALGWTTKRVLGATASVALLVVAPYSCSHAAGEVAAEVSTGQRVKSLGEYGISAFDSAKDRVHEIYRKLSKEKEE